ncbi:MAG: hypothetical protein KatS3mg105_0743 [Gemmatales bacterium]|nr:MAG: hypothetical protein KatS3mg105_0743 [Gemmatales bacterium]
MRPLTLDDLLPLDEYADKRQEFFASLSRYLDNYRRIRIGPELTLVFENRQTLWYRVHEVLCVARLAEPDRVQEELDVYNQLLPSRNRLQAALLIDVDEKAPLKSLAFWSGLRGDDLRLQIGVDSVPAQLLTCRPEDRCIGAAHWVYFEFNPRARQLFADWSRPAYFQITYSTYRYDSPPLNEDIRQSLLDDLELSDQE